MKKRNAAFVVALAVCGAIAAWSSGCGSNDSSSDGADAATSDAATDDGGTESDALIDGGVDSGSDGAIVETDGGIWSYADLTLVDPAARGYEGSAFDGRYLYLVPKDTGLVARYDTQRPFPAVTSWSIMDVAKVPLVAGADGGTDAGAKDEGFVGAIFDGRYVYFIPWQNQLAPNSQIARYDTKAVFDQVESWRLFDLATVDPLAQGFIGGVFDGRYVYFVPNANDNGGSGVAARYDTSAPFDAKTSYQTFDLGAIDPNARGFFGGVFDGKYVYLVPFVPATARSGLVVRYDIAASFTAKASWQTFDTTTVDPGAKGFAGGAFDGRYVYLVPANNDDPDGILARYDTQAAFGAKTSWSTFDVSAGNPKAKGFVGAAFDGRFLFLPPFSAVLGTFTDVMVSYDTTTPFGDGGAVTTFPFSSLVDYTKGYAGAGFDGRYVYFTPYWGSVVIRYDARRPPALPEHPASFL